MDVCPRLRTSKTYTPTAEGASGARHEWRSRAAARGVGVRAGISRHHKDPADRDYGRALTVTSIGTICPSRMYSLIIWPYWLPSRACSARRRSPAGSTEGESAPNSQQHGFEQGRPTGQVYEVVVFDEVGALRALAYDHDGEDHVRAGRQWQRASSAGGMKSQGGRAQRRAQKSDPRTDTRSAKDKENNDLLFAERRRLTHGRARGRDVGRSGGRAGGRRRFGGSRGSSLRLGGR